MQKKEEEENVKKKKLKKSGEAISLQKVCIYVSCPLSL